MTELQPDYSEIEPFELVRYLLKESGQEHINSINPAQMLDFLKLDYEILDLDTITQEIRYLTKKSPRAVLSFSDKIIIVDSKLNENQSRFSILHEIAHYVLPSHQKKLYVCDDKDLDISTQYSIEKEANDFAADLLFMGDRFILDANSERICADTVKKLAEKYKASFESTARRLVTKNIRPCMLLVFRVINDRYAINTNLSKKWIVHYCISSKAFKTKYFSSARGEVPDEVVAQLTEQTRDISDSIKTERSITIHKTGKKSDFTVEYFYNQYNIFALLVPKHTILNTG